MLILDPGNNLLFEVYQANKNGAAWSGFLATWTYQLSLLDSVWRVERERWD